MRRSVWNWLFLLSSFGLILMFLVTVTQDTLPEWIRYQAEYHRRLAQVTGDRSKAFTLPKVRQIYLPEMKRVDRCITCHMGVDNPKMADQPQPYRTHPDLGIPGFLVKHPFNEIGCTVCHHGQGPATTVEHAHGPVHHWEEPLLRKGLTVAACATCHQNTRELKGAERLVQARALFVEKGCIGCHNLHGKGMLVGPELAETFGKSVGDQFDFKYVKGPHTLINWVEEHFKDPQAVVPGYPKIGVPESAMPNYGLDDEEVELLTALTLSFYLEEESEHHPIPARYRVPGTPEPEPTYTSPVERGAAVFTKLGCVGCHGPQGRGGIRNMNMDLGEEVPALTYVSDGYSKEELKAIIRDGRYPARADRHGPSPPLWMPSWKEKLTEEELDALVEYLYSLHP